MERLRLYYPCRPHRTTQDWGDNQACVINFGEKNQHVTGKKGGVCPSGYEELYPLFGMRGHNGLDLLAGVQPIHASCAGTVIEVQTAPARGLGIGILSDEKYDFGKFGQMYAKLRYWHLKEIHVKAGQKVKVGDIIGISNSTGYSSGNHLHYELQLFDKDEGGHPMQFIHKDMIAGSVDPAPYWTGMHADDFHTAITLTQRLIAALTLFVTELKKPR